MYLLILAVPVIWTVVLTIFLLKNPRTLATLVRWTLWTYLFVLAMLLSEILREGLAEPAADDILENAAGVDDRDALVQEAGLWWFLWALTVASGALTPWALAPAAAMPAVLLRYPPFRVLVDVGLARLGWTAAVYSPFLWLAARLGHLLWHWHSWRSVLGFIAAADGRVSWIVDRVLAASVATYASGGTPGEHEWVRS